MPTLKIKVNIENFFSECKPELQRPYRELRALEGFLSGEEDKRWEVNLKTRMLATTKLV